MTALVLSLLLAADPGAPALIPDVGLPCQQATIVEFLDLVRTGATTVGDVQRLSELNHDGEPEGEFQRCLAYPDAMKALLCKAPAGPCSFYPAIPEAEITKRAHDGFLSGEQENVVRMRAGANAKSEFAAYLLFRWPKVFRSRVSANDISGPWKDAKDQVSIYYRVKTSAGDVVVGFVRDQCTIWDIALPGGQSISDAPMDCFWRQKVGKQAPASPPAQDGAKAATPRAP